MTVSDIMHARHLASLGFLQQILEQEELSTQLMERSEDVPIHLLLAGIQQDVEGRDRYLQFSFLPLEDEMPSVDLLQIYSAYPFALEQGQKEQFAQLIPELNSRSPIGHVGISESGEIHYRYVYALSSNATFDQDETVELLGLFIHIFDMFAAPLEQVASGSRDASEVIAELR